MQNSNKLGAQTKPESLADLATVIELPASSSKAAKQPAKTKKPPSEKQQRIQQLIAKFTAMTEDERSAAVAGCLIKNVEGHPLSLRNTYLLLAQRPGVSLVGGFRQWLTQGRCVAKGEHGLLIAIPGTKKVDTGEDAEIRAMYFRTASVFDISQTVELTVEATA